VHFSAIACCTCQAEDAPSENCMKRLMALTLLFLLTTLPAFGRGSHSHHSTRATTNTTACCSRSTSDVHVHGYTKRDGTVVHAYTRTHENGTQQDNFSTKGNVNPYTGKVGTKKATH
jgi:hypothetical protein